MSLLECILFMLDTAGTTFVLILFCSVLTTVLGLLALLVHMEVVVVTICLFNVTAVHSLGCPDTVVLSLESESEFITKIILN